MRLSSHEWSNLVAVRATVKPAVSGDLHANWTLHALKNSINRNQFFFSFCSQIFMSLFMRHNTSANNSDGMNNRATARTMIIASAGLLDLSLSEAETISSNVAAFFAIAAVLCSTTA